MVELEPSSKIDDVETLPQSEQGVFGTEDSSSKMVASATKSIDVEDTIEASYLEGTRGSQL